MNIWAKARTGKESALMVKYAPGMNFFELLEAITEKRKALGRVGALQAIHTQNSGDKQYECKVGCEVPVPLANEVGSSDDMPYFFSIVQTETGGYNFEEVKPQFINGETLYEREQSAVLIANILTSGSGKKYTPICDNVFGAGKTSFIYKFRTILGDDNFPGKGPSYEELKSAVYLHIPFRPFGHHGPTYAECLDKALRIVRNVLAISCRCKEEDLCVDSLSSFTVSLAGICPLGSRRLLLHFDDVGSYEPMGNTLGGLMLHAMWRIGDKLRDQQHYFVMTGRSALLHLIGTERLLIEQQVTPDTGMVIPLPPLSVNAVRKMMVEYGVEGVLDQAELIHSLTAGIPRAVYTVVHYFKANPTAKLLKESMDAVMAALNAACPQTLWSNDGDRLLFQRCVELAWAGVKFTNDSHMAGEAVTSFIARLGLFRQPVDGNADKFELLVPQQQR